VLTHRVVFDQEGEPRLMIFNRKPFADNEQGYTFEYSGKLEEAKLAEALEAIARDVRTIWYKNEST
jgi:hypothetical protein